MPVSRYAQAVTHVLLRSRLKMLVFRKPILFWAIVGWVLSGPLNLFFLALAIPEAIDAYDRIQNGRAGFGFDKATLAAHSDIVELILLISIPSALASFASLFVLRHGQVTTERIMKILVLMAVAAIPIASILYFMPGLTDLGQILIAAFIPLLMFPIAFIFGAPAVFFAMLVFRFIIFRKDT
jgi:hypothetical protein